MPVKKKITHLKGLSKRARMAFDSSQIASLVQEIFKFLFKIWWRHKSFQYKDKSQNQEYLGKYWSDATKTGTKMTPTVLLPWQHSCFRIYLMLDWHSHFLSKPDNVYSQWAWYLVHSKKGLGPRVIPWQRQNGCHFVSYLAYLPYGAWARSTSGSQNWLSYVISKWHFTVD